MDYNRNLSESLAVLGVIAPVSQAAGTVLTAAINTNLSRRILFLVQAGTPGGGGTINFKVTAAPTSGGSYIDVTGAAITQLSAAGTAIVEVKAETLAALGVGPWIKGSLTVGTATSPVSAIALGGCSRFEANSDYSVAGTAAAVVV